MLKNIFFGVYLQSSFFVASYMIINSFVSRFYYRTEKIVFSYLLSVANITIFMLALNLIPKGINTTNMVLISQIYFLFSIFVSIIKKKKLIFHLPSFNIKNILSLKNKLAWILAASFLIDVLIFLWIIYLLPITDGDTVAYHLQSPPNWYQNQSLAIFPTNDLRNMSFPDNQNFLVLWNFLSFKTDILKGLIPYGYLLLSILVIFTFLQRLRDNKGLNFVISLLFYYDLWHIVYAKTFTGDVGAVALFLASLSLLYSYLKFGKFAYFVFFSIANGLLLGIKNIGLIDILIIYFLSISYEVFIKKNSLKKIFALYFSSLIICFILGGFQYLRNIIYLHNPIYPKSLSLGFINFPGPPGDLYWKTFEPNLIRMLNTFLTFLKEGLKGTFSYQFPLFYLPSFLVLFFFYRKKLEKSFILILTILIISTILFASSAITNDWRYFFPLSFLGIACLGNLIYTSSDKYLEKCFYLLLSLFILFTPSEGKSIDRFKELLYISKKTVSEREVGELYYDADTHFFRRNIPQGTNIMYFLPENAPIYQYYGSHYQNKLIYANTDDINQIEKTIREKKIDYFMAKSKNSDLGTFFYWWDLENGKLISLPEDKVKEIIAQLLKGQRIQEIGTGLRITFYKVNYPSP